MGPGFEGICWLIFIVPEGATQAAGGENIIHDLSSVSLCQAWCAHCCNDGMTIMKVTNWFMTVFEAHSRTGNLWLVP